jgi:3-hydroxyisobutyrate dehydrogenase-like beta-hydroxyacid dehydrogenase
LAQRAGIDDVASLNDLVTEADIVLSILVPAEAVGVAESVAGALSATGAGTPFADCNAISPQSATAIDGVIGHAGGRFIDGGIIGGPPGRGTPPRFYVSGPHAGVMTELDGKGIDVRPIGESVGKASGIKMCYAAMTKGTSTLHVALLTAAEALGLSDELAAELQASQPGAYEQMARIPALPVDAARWIGEMEEIASTFEHVGVTPGFHRGAAEVYRLLSETPFASETRETLDRSRTLVETIRAVVDLLPAEPARTG